MTSEGSETTRACIFCTAVLDRNSRSREHVFPIWILRYFQIKDHVISPRAWQGDCELYGHRRHHPLASFRLGGVCSACNAGWMSRLEQLAKPQLLALSSGQRHLSDLTHREQWILARWATKTAFVLHAATYAEPKIPLALYPEIRNANKRLPPGIAVVGLQTPDLAEDLLAVTAIQSDRFMMIRPLGAAEQLSRWKISLRVGILQLLISYCSDTSWHVVGWRGVHKALWPTKVDLSYVAGLRRDCVHPHKESGTVLFHISLALASGLRQDQIDRIPRPPIEEELQRFFDRP